MVGWCWQPQVHRHCLKVITNHIQIYRSEVGDYLKEAIAQELPEIRKLHVDGATYFVTDNHPLYMLLQKQEILVAFNFCGTKISRSFLVIFSSVWYNNHNTYPPFLTSPIAVWVLRAHESRLSPSPTWTVGANPTFPRWVYLSGEVPAAS